MTDNSEKNPFNKEEPLQTWFEQDKFYQHSNGRDLGKLKVKLNYKPSIFMSLQDSYLKTIQAITKHAILATLVMLIALGGVGASAAQILAPEAYKPSSIIQKTFNPKDFETNKQPDKNPYTALKPDQNNDVTKLDKCDLAIKYPKQIGQTPIKIFNDYNTDPAFASFRIYDGYQFTDQYSNQGSKQDAEKNVKLEGMYVDCVNTDYQKARLIEMGINVESYTQLLSKAQLQQMTGWFITEADISNIRFWDNGYGLISLSFDFRDKSYNMNFIDQIAREEGKKAEAKKDPISLQSITSTGYFERPGIFGNQVQIQFNSLVENEASTDVVDKPNTPSSNTSSSNSTSSTTKTSLELKNEEFAVISGGQMRYKLDASGGFDLKRSKDGKIFAIMSSTLDSQGVKLQSDMKLTLSGNYLSIPTDDTFGGGSGNASFIITSLNSLEIDKNSKISRVLDQCNLQITYSVFANNFSGKLAQINEENLMASLTGFPVNPPVNLEGATFLVMDTTTDPLNRQDGIGLQTDCYQGAVDIDKNISWFNRSPIGSAATLTKPTKADFCKDYNMTATDCGKINNLNKISYDSNWTSCYYNTFTALNKTFVIHNCNFLAKGVGLSFK